MLLFIVLKLISFLCFVSVLLQSMCVKFFCLSLYTLDNCFYGDSLVVKASHKYRKYIAVHGY